jgi:hypothetical protein
MREAPKKRRHFCSAQIGPNMLEIGEFATKQGLVELIPCLFTTNTLAAS